MDYALKLDEVQKYAEGKGKLQYEFSNKGGRGVTLVFEPKRLQKGQKQSDENRNVQSKN